MLHASELHATMLKPRSGSWQFKQNALQILQGMAYGMESLH